MPLYKYRCVSCGVEEELLQTHSQMEKECKKLRCKECGARMRYVFSVPNLFTETTFTIGMDDGFGNNDFKRRIAYKKAREAGVNPTGKIYCPGLCRRGMPYDPRAWVSASNARAEARKRCRELGYASEDLGVKHVEPENDPQDKPYRPAPSLVQKEVDLIVEREYDGKIDKKKRQQLVEEVTERGAGSLGRK